MCVGFWSPNRRLFFLGQSPNWKCWNQDTSLELLKKFKVFLGLVLDFIFLQYLFNFDVVMNGFEEICHFTLSVFLYRSFCRFILLPTLFVAHSS